MLQWPSFNYSLITNKTFNVTSTYSYKINVLRPLEGIPYSHFNHLHSKLQISHCHGSWNVLILKHTV